LIHDPAGDQPRELEDAVLALSAVRAVHFAVGIQAVGALLFVWILHRLPEAAAESSARRWLMRAAILLALAMLPSGAAWIALQAADMTGRPLSEVWGDGAVGLLLFKTHAGVVWWVRFAIALAFLINLCVMASLRHGPSEATVLVGLALAIANFVSCAWLSHAGSDAGPYASLHLATHALHMLGVSLWLGGFIPLAMLVSRALHSGDMGAATAARAASVLFGNIALVAVVIIVVSGITTTALVVRDISDLTTGSYAGLLAVKLVLFCLMLALAAVNRVQLVPRLATSNPGPAATRLWWSILGELVLGMMILIVVGELGITPLGADE
jgi:copper resistance protein D